MLSLVVPECNSTGLALFPGKSFEDIEASNGEDTLVILENDLYRRAGKSFVDGLLNSAKHIIVIDQLNNSTTEKADILLPAATFADSEGTILSNEGRAQRFYKAIINKNQVKESWRWLEDLIKIRNVNHTSAWNILDDIIDSLVNEMPFFAKLKTYMPDADYRMLNAKIPRQTIRYSGRTAITANKNVSEPKLQDDKDSPLAFSMEGIQQKPPSSLVPFYWTPGWNSVQAMYNYVDEPDSSLKGGDPGIRLFDTKNPAEFSYIKTVRESATLKNDEWLIIPRYQIFGSEELSALSPSVKQKISDPFVILNQKDAEKLSVKEGDLVQLDIQNDKLNVKVIMSSEIGQGIAALSVNLNGMPYIGLPGSGKFHKL
jgi:NADH-quinone oxidoreductase subunit G